MADSDSTPTRCCTNCHVEKPATLEFFPHHKPGKYGLHSWCLPCKKQIDTARRNRPDQQSRQKAWRDANKRYIKDYNQKYRAEGYKSTEDVAAWRAANLERARKMTRDGMRRRRAADPERFREIARKWREANYDKWLAQHRATGNRRYRTLAWVNLRVRISSRMRQMLRRVGGKGRKKTEALLGYSRGELIRHIERQFTNRMSWEKVLDGSIHIDHIIPCAAFKVTSIDSPEFKACWAMSNLRPMWATANHQKYSKIETLL